MTTRRAEKGDVTLSEMQERIVPLQTTHHLLRSVCDPSEDPFHDFHRCHVPLPL